MLADIIVSILFAAVGLAFCFAGYRFFLILLPIFGFLVGFWVGSSAITALFGDGFLSTVSSWLSGLIVALIFAALSYLFYWLAIVIFGLSLGASIGSGIMSAIGVDARILTFVVAAVLAVAFAALFLAINLQKYLIVFLSSFAGATVVLAGFMLLIGTIERSDLYQGAVTAIINQSFFWSLAWFVLTIAGLGIQVLTTTDLTTETPEPPMSVSV